MEHRESSSAQRQDGQRNAERRNERELALALRGVMERREGRLFVAWLYFGLAQIEEPVLRPNAAIKDGVAMFGLTAAADGYREMAGDLKRKMLAVCPSLWWQMVSEHAQGQDVERALREQAISTGDDTE